MGQYQRSLADYTVKRQDGRVRLEDEQKSLLLTDVQGFSIKGGKQYHAVSGHALSYVN